MKNSKAYFFAISILMFVACGNESRVVSNTSVYIINGTVDNDPLHDAVPFLYNTSGYSCGATLIAPNIIMTAGHCAAIHNTSNPASPSSYEVYFCRDMTNCDATKRKRGVIELYLHPYYDNTNTSYDFALMRLDAPAPGDVAIIPPLPSSMALSSSDVGSSITFSGFGLTDGYDDTSTSTQRLQFTGTIAGICDSNQFCSLGSGYYAAPYTIYTSQASGGTCQGDSGGPGLVNKSGTTYVAGITSYGYNNCTGPGVYTAVSYYANEISNFINNPPNEVCGDGVDNDGNGMTDCSDPVCGTQSSCPSSPCTTGNYLVCNHSEYGTTRQGTAAFSNYSCLSSGAEDGSEIAWLLSMPPGAVAHITLDEMDQDLDLFILEGTSDSCDPGSCSESSIETGLSSESIDYTVTADTPAWLIIESYKYPGSFKISVDCDLPPENCTNGIDDDLNYKTDCDDPACYSDEACQNPAAETICNDNIDNDEDGFTDCDDSDCTESYACGGHKEIACGDSLDNDQDGLTDCDDPDCSVSIACDDGNTDPKDDKSSGSGFGCSQSNNFPKKSPLPVSLILLSLLAVFKTKR